MIASLSQPPSLTGWLRERSDAELGELLRRRPDLALPAPADLATLAGRLSARTSVQRAVDSLDAFTLRVLEAISLSALTGEPVRLADAAKLLGEDADIGAAAADLLALGLVWGDADKLYAVATVREALGSYPAGLGRPAAVLLRHVSDVQLAPVLRSLGLPPAAQPRAGTAIAEVLGDSNRLDELLASVDSAERDVLERLAAGPPVGRVREAQLPAARADLPPHRLIFRGLLVPIDAQTVELPREVGVALRDVPLGSVSVEPPVVEVHERAPAELDRLGTTAVLEVLRLVEALGESWTAHPPTQLRAGGVGVRELRRTAKELGVDEPVAALVAEIAASTGLINSTHGIEPVYLPSAEYDIWRRHDPAARWADLALAWLGMTRQPSLVNKRGERDRLITVLGPDAERGTIPALRRRLLDVLSALSPGAAPQSREGVLDRLAWQAPRRASGQRPLADAVLAEADLIGFTAAGGLTGYSRTLLAGSRAVAEQVLSDAMPAPVTHFLVQPDLTIVVPGPPTADLAAELALTADLESTGGASVYRVTESSVRRALDAGRSGSDIGTMIAERSRTPVPQALQYLIDDLSRRHGALRSGAAASYLRCDDEALLARVLADRDVGAVQLRRIAPTVAVSSAPVARVLDVLREAGYPPAAESPGGDLIALDTQPPRAPARQPVRTVRANGALDSGVGLSELVQRVRSGDALTEMTRVHPVAHQVPGVTSAATMGVLREAIRAGRQVLLGIADTDGQQARHQLLPISMAGGVVRGHEPGATGLRSFPLHRITAVSVLGESSEE
ncbi:MAG: helicase-associated domain-containing protein [Actinomycetota bacterium]|nr:helicase-associated domain-containing protein [Actinomycetota bacterium]